MTYAQGVAFFAFKFGMMGAGAFLLARELNVDPWLIWLGAWLLHSGLTMTAPREWFSGRN